MTQLTRNDIAEFKELYKKHFEIELDDNEARRKLSLLVRQVEIVYQPITTQQFRAFVERDLNKSRLAIRNVKNEHSQN